MKYKETPLNFSVFYELLPFWMLKHVLNYRKEQPNIQNIFEIPQFLKPDNLFEKLRVLWAAECKKESPNLASNLKHLLGKEYFHSILYNSISNFFNVCAYISIYFIYHYLNYDYSASQGILIAFLTGFCIAISTITRKFAFLRVYYIKNKLIYLLISLIQEKILKIDSNLTIKSEEISKIINSATTDLEIIALLDATLDLLGIVPKILACIGILIWILGPIGLIGFGVSLIHIPIILCISISMLKQKKNSEKLTQLRIEKMKNFIESIQILKMFVWEKPFIKEIHEKRYKEISYLKKFDMIRGVLQAITLGGICLSIFITFVVYKYYGRPLNLGEVLLVINCLYSMQIFLPYVSILGLSVIFMIKQAIQKVENVLLMQEFEEDHGIMTEEIKHPRKNDYLITSFKNTDSIESFNQLNINFQINTGELTMVVGKVGSGKSRVLLSLLGEVINKDLNIFKFKDIAYFSENPWIMNASIKENILMGRPFIQDLYADVIKSCCLEDDISHMPNLDENIISDRGTTLSGGQKARLSLARVLYSQFDIYLLDDPFSSLDTKVLKKVFNRSILKMLSNKTRVLVMRNYDYLHYADKILVVSDNEYYFYKSFEEFQKIYTVHDFNEFTINRTIVNSNSNLITNQLANQNYDCNYIISYIEPLKFQTYYKYLMLGFKSRIMIILALVFSIGSVISVVFFYYTTAGYSNSDPTNIKNLNFLGVLILVYALFFLTLVPLTYFISNSNLLLHQHAATKISKLPSSYFDENSCGMILNKFTKDISIIDYILFPNIQGLSVMLFPLLTQLIIIVIVQPYTSISVIIFCIEVFLVGKYILPVSNSIRRLEIILAGPVISMISSVLSGLLTIRSLKIQNYMSILMKKTY